MRNFLNYRLSILFLFSIFTFISCSKDSDDPTPPEVTVTVSTVDFSITMDENPTNGQTIGTVQGSTNQGTVTFSITEQTPSGAFSIDAASGELKVADASLFDFETNPTIVGTVKVANGSTSKDAMVTVTLNDVNEDNVYNGNIELFTQAEVDDFGANNYTHITGYLFIGKLDNTQSSLYDLSPLHALKSIGSTFIIIDNPFLSNLNGLENLEFTGANLLIQDNPSLKSIESLSKLTSINHYLAIYDNDQLINLDGLQNIETIQRELAISSNHSLENINSLAGLSSVGGNITITDNWILQNFNLQNLTNINGRLMISNNYEITNLDGLSSLTSIEGGLSVQLNYLLQNFCGLSNVFMGGNFNGFYTVNSNAFDPTQQDLIDGNCSL